FAARGGAVGRGARCRRVRAARLAGCRRRRLADRRPVDRPARMGTMSVNVTAGAGPGEVVVRDGDRIDRMYAVSAGGVSWVFHDGAVYRLEGEASPRRAPQTHGSLSSPVPATVISVAVAPGGEVAG